MTRSPGQRTARWLRREQLPHFPLLKLPAELQLQVLCKCDLTSIRRLLELCPSLVDLFIRYSETCLREIRSQMPRPIGNLLWVSWALHSVREEEFDSEKTMNMMSEHTNVMDWADGYVSVLPFDDDPLVTLDRWIDLYDEVRVIAEIYAHNTGVLLESFANPFVQVAPVQLSVTEFSRIVSAFLVLRIYYQLQLKFREQQRYNSWTVDLMQCLEPWQKHQASSVEQFLKCIGNRRASPFYDMVLGMWHSKDQLLATSEYARNFFKLFYPWNRGSHALQSPVSFTRASMLNTPGWAVLQPSVPDLQSTPSSRVTQLRNHGWLYFEEVMKRESITSKQFMNLFVDLGVFFWDLDRLTKLDIIDPKNVQHVLQRIEDRHEYARVCGTW